MKITDKYATLKSNCHQELNRRREEYWASGKKGGVFDASLKISTVATGVRNSLVLASIVYLKEEIDKIEKQLTILKELEQNEPKPWWDNEKL